MNHICKICISTSKVRVSINYTNFHYAGCEPINVAQECGAGYIDDSYNED